MEAQVSPLPRATAPKRATKPRAAPRKPATSVKLPTAPDLAAMIADAAYFLAASRGFAPGHELDDWLEAERQILAIRR